MVVVLVFVFSVKALDDRLRFPVFLGESDSRMGGLWWVDWGVDLERVVVQMVLNYPVDHRVQLLNYLLPVRLLPMLESMLYF